MPLEPHADRPDIGVLALFMFATGARISEALAVRWDDIDFKNVKFSFVKLSSETSGRRTLPPDLFLALANLPRDRKPFAFAGHSSALKAWNRAVTAAGIEPLTFHSCRHGFATALNDKGVGVKTIAKLGGWKSAQHLFQTYLHADEDATLTDRIFDTDADTLGNANASEINRLSGVCTTHIGEYADNAIVEK
jgi:integrase